MCAVALEFKTTTQQLDLMLYKDEFSAVFPWNVACLLVNSMVGIEGDVALNVSLPRFLFIALGPSVRSTAMSFAEFS